MGQLLAEGERSVYEPRRASARRRKPSARRYAHHGRKVQNARTQSRTHCRAQNGLRTQKEEGITLKLTVIVIVMRMSVSVWMSAAASDCAYSFIRHCYHFMF